MFGNKRLRRYCGVLFSGSEPPLPFARVTKLIKLKMTIQLNEIENISIGIIGGSGLYSLENMKIEGEILVQTPFGNPSDSIVIGDLGGIRVGFLARHGRGHYLNPSDVPSKANIAALKKIGCKGKFYYFVLLFCYYILLCYYYAIITQYYMLLCNIMLSLRDKEDNY